MAEEEAGIFVNQEQFSCPICMELLRNPVTIPCGHNYCMDCIKSFWEQKNQRKMCSCPECRQTFSPRPVLNKNTLFAEVVEKMRLTGVRSICATEAKNQADSEEKQDIVLFCKQELEQSKERCQQFIKEREEEVQQLSQAILSLRNSGQAVVENTEKIFAELTGSVEAVCSEVKDMIKNKEQMELDEAHGYMEKMEQEIAEMKRRDAEYDRLSQLEDKTQFLKGYELLCGQSEMEISPAILVNPDFSFEMVSGKLEDLSEAINSLCQKKLDKLANKVKTLKFIPTPEPKIRKEFLEYSGPLTLDQNSAHRNLSVSAESGEVTHSKTSLSVPDHPERFDGHCQILCMESVTGRCYFEAEWNGKGPVHVAMSYEDISRKGKSSVCAFGHNTLSWCLVCSEDTYAFWHNGKETKLPKTPGLGTRRAGVYLDFSAGILAFYSITDSMNLIYRIRTAFAQPLYPGFKISPASSVRLCYPLS